MAAVTAKQIAQYLGISQSAVSIVLNGKGGVSEETRQLVLNTAEKLGYNPAKLTSLKNRHKSLCFIFYVNHLVSIAENTTFSSFVLKGAEAAASSLGFSIFVRYFHAGENIVDQLEGVLKATDGIIILGTDITDESEAEIRQLLDRVQALPVVIIDSLKNFGSADCVCNDNYGGAAQAASYLISRGCRNIGYIRSKQRMDIFNLREAGLRNTLDAAGLTLDTVIDTDVSFDEAFNRVDAYLSSVSELPDSFFAENDIIAAAAIRALNAHNIKVPEQVSIIGFDDIPICDLTAPSLTTIHSFKEQLGTAAVHVLASKSSYLSPGMDFAEHGCMNISVSTSLHIRDSVR